jgi:hypothetical protein
MWLFTSQGFVSIVADRDSQDHLLVRGRVRDHLKALFPTTAITETPDADYLFRATLSHKVVAQVVADQVNAIDYCNFKDSVTDAPYHSSCLRVWSSMHQLQLQTPRGEGKTIR